jgi:hypothetical protein
MAKPTIESRDMIFTGKVTFTRGINLDMRNENDHAIRITSASRSHYPIISWYNRAKQFMYGIVAHEVTHDGITHNHASEYFADDTAKNGKRGKLDKQFGKPHSTFSLEGMTLLAKSDAAIALTDKVTGKAYELVINDGVLSVLELDKVALLSAGSLPTVENPTI